ncbi:TPA: hypothetical protein EYP13_04355, partial [Candidatus Micrarchaeota archaeon]|nr:hypothetical protein [Candidatus Micrarchaeota archaeon]
MLIKFLSHSTGSVRSAVEYVLAEHDHLGQKREEVRVLRGNPDIVAMVGDSLKNKHKYFSGVIAWHPDDAPSDEELQAVLDRWEGVAFPGMKGRVPYVAVLHRERDGGVHVHLVGVRVDTETGKAYNPAPPGWERIYRPFREWANLLYGWKDPDAPEHRRLFSPGKKALLKRQEDKALNLPPSNRLKQAIRVEPDPREILAEYAARLVEMGIVRTREDLIEAYREAGFEIPRIGKKYITVRDPETGKRFRLRGAIFEEDFDVEQWRTRERSRRKDAGPDGGPDPGNRGDTERRLAEVEREMDEVVRRRTEYNRRRYQAGREGNPNRDPGPISTPTPSHALDLAVGRKSGFGPHFLEHDSGADTSPPFSPARGGETQDGKGDGAGIPGRDTSTSIPDTGWPNGYLDTKEVSHENHIGAGNHPDGIFKEAREAVRTGHEKAR